MNYQEVYQQRLGAMTKSFILGNKIKEEIEIKSIEMQSLLVSMKIWSRLLERLYTKTSIIVVEMYWCTQAYSTE